MNSTPSFEDPFSEINANLIKPSKLLAYWCNPFEASNLMHIDEHQFATSPLPIILQGSRGSGKTTILKYFSYPVLKERASSVNNIANLIEKNNSVGIYLRCTESFINTFTTIFSNIDEAKRIVIFKHYLELFLVKNILAIAVDLVTYDATFSDYEEKILLSLNNEAHESVLDGLKTFQEFISRIDKEIRYIDRYKNEVIFEINPVFMPGTIFELYDISSRLIRLIGEFDSRFKDVVFLLLIDEFENLTEELQKMFNQLMKFTTEDSHIAFRIGRRREGSVTSETINYNEYLRDKNDYRLINLDVFSDPNEINVVKNYFKDIISKRFESSEIYRGHDIIGILGDSENLDAECKEICSNNKKHLVKILSENRQLKHNPELCNQVIDIIRYDDNVIAETLNALKVARYTGSNYIDEAENIKKAMLSYFMKTDDKDALSLKYKNDYTNKYRYSIAVLLCSIYKKRKLYYGFNTIVYLSGGNPRLFLNICQAIVSSALFYEKRKFTETFVISKEIQSKAIREFAIQELSDVCSIMKYGDNIKNLIYNIGNVFSRYHKDLRIRYPETNQFSFDPLLLDIEQREMIKSAEMWSMIIKKSNRQRMSLSIDSKGELYTLNKVFSPIFDISYRTRGGYNEIFSPEIIVKMLSQRIDIIDNNMGDMQKTLF